jgi:hypothetical protein
MAGNPTLVLAFFESEETADGAAGALLGWAKGIAGCSSTPSASS